MPRYEVNALTLLAVLIAAGLGGTIAADSPIFGRPLVGVVLLIILFSYDREGYRSMGQSLGFGAVAGYCAMRIVLPLLPYFVPSFLGPLPWVLILWIAATLVLWAIDISRMQKRAASHAYAAVPVTSPESSVREEFVRAQTAAPPPPAPARAKPVTSIFAEQSSTPTPPPLIVRPEPIISEETPNPRTTVPESVASPAPPTPTSFNPPTPPQAVAIPRGSGKPATIYLNLIGEGLAVLRAVQAEHIGKDYYLIVEQMPPGETWEFQTGQVVRCQKRNLSSGKALVAVEEAPRAS